MSALASRLGGRGAIRIAAIVVALLVAATAVTGFVSSLTRTLQSIDRHEGRLVVLQGRANDSLAELGPKVARLRSIRVQAAAVSGTLAGVDTDLSAVNGRVRVLDTRLAVIARRLVGVSKGIRGLSGSVDGISGRLGTLSGSLGATAGKVDRLSGDVNAIASSLGAFPAALQATNNRLGYINTVVGRLGHRGVTSRIGLAVLLNDRPIGRASITAVLIPARAW